MKISLITAFTVATVLLVSLGAAGDVKFNSGQSRFHLESVNADINLNLTQDFSDVKARDDRIKLDTSNFTVKNFSNRRIVVDIRKWNSSAQKTDTLVNFTANTTGSSAVQFGLTNLSSNTNYTIDEGKSFLKFKNSSSSGSLKFNHSSWSRHNFSIRQTNTTTPSSSSPDNNNDDDDDGGGGSGGAVDTGPPSFSHSWSVEGKTSFETDTSDDLDVLRKIEVETSAGKDSFSISGEELDSKPSSVEEIDAAHQYVNLSASDEDNISSVTLEFEVDKYFADNHDKVLVKHYENRWGDLETALIESKTGMNVYQANSTGFSYYAVAGENETEEEENQAKTSEDANQTGPACGDNTCSQNETWKSCSQDCGKPEKVEKAEKVIDEAEQEVSEGEEGYQQLERAKKAFEAGNYSQAEKLASGLVEDEDAEERFQLPAIFYVLIAALSVIFGSLAVVTYTGNWERLQRLPEEIREKLGS